MQVLCHEEVHHDSFRDVASAISLEAELSGSTKEHAETICKHYLSDRDRVDGPISQSLERWTIERLDPVDRNVLRVAAVELLLGNVPIDVVFNEAIEIARAYGSKNSSRFVHGVLDAVGAKLKSQG
jgi:transcription antitermination protein NusB